MVDVHDRYSHNAIPAQHHPTALDSRSRSITLPTTRFADPF